MSKSLSRWSREPVTNQLPLTPHPRHLTVFLCAWIVSRQVPVLASQSLVLWSFPPLRMMGLVGCHSQHLTSQWWPFISLSHVPVSKSQIFRRQSSDPDTNFRSEGAKLSCRTLSLWPCTFLTSFMLFIQYLTTPALSADTMNSLLWLHVMLCTAVSCPCQMVMKLNSKPSHSVNSPWLLPAMRPLPSGVHEMEKTGHLWE
mmetsp:Transcript_12048/g.30146  ORF Transcript_12048/g.30146 Transcript_12048/m.30146 type:complete len:200 (-) Transcript_12048:443-1042(-)